jgi:asparagine synthase (glutamine-hydrolysing)
MSAQAGIFHFDRRPVPPDAPARLLDSLAEYGPDGGSSHMAPGLVMVYQAMHVTPEDELEEQPLISARGQVMTWDGRLDNRHELVMQLWHRLHGGRTDVALALGTIESEGLEGLRSLIGDWSLVHYDSEEDSISLACDFAGNRPLFYSVDRDALQWSTSLGELTNRLGTFSELNSRFLIGLLTGTMEPEATPFTAIRSVRPGHAMTWTRQGSPRVRRLWSPETRAVRYKDSRDYEAHLRAVFAEGIRARLRARGRVWAELSGGLDSSCVCCMGDLLIRTGQTAATGLDTVSAITNHSPESDERTFAEAVEAQLSGRHEHIVLDGLTELVDEDKAWATPYHPGGAALAFMRCVRDSGSRVLVTGNPGDLVMGQTPDEGEGALEAWSAGTFWSWLSYCRHSSRASQQPIWACIRNMGLLTRSHHRFVKARIRRCLRARGVDSGRDLSRAAQDAFLLTGPAADHWIAEMTRRALFVRSIEDETKRPLVEGLMWFIESRSLESPSEFAGVRYTHGYAHRPLVELALSIPVSVRQRPHEPRALMRRAFSSFTPSKTMRRFSKGYPAPFLVRDMRKALTRLPANVKTWEVVQRGLVEPAALQTRVNELQSGASRGTGNVRSVLVLERWLSLQRHDLPFRISA